MKTKSDFNQIKKSFTKVCRENGLMKDHILKKFMTDFITKHSKVETTMEENVIEMEQDDNKVVNELEAKPLSFKERKKKFDESQVDTSKLSNEAKEKLLGNS